MRLHFLPVIIYAGVACGLDAMKSIKQMWYLQTFLTVHFVENGTNTLLLHQLDSFWRRFDASSMSKLAKGREMEEVLKALSVCPLRSSHTG